MVGPRFDLVRVVTIVIIFPIQSVGLGDEGEKDHARAVKKTGQQRGGS
jgi:hypothetical protein